MSDFRDTLYTIGKTGQRKWVYPTIINGRFHRWRGAVALVLLLIYLLIPWLIVDGQQAILLDIANRKFIFFGATLWATDSYFLVMVFGALAIALFFFTALLGRVWCGWACPETVFLEFVFRPIEALIEGTPAQRLRRDQGPWSGDKMLRKSVKLTVFAFLAWFIASTFLAYFVGADRLVRMMTAAPTHNPSTFIATLVLMGILLFQFGWFREQFCTVMCPYARFQSVLMDPHSLLVGYDAKRGEPRGKLEHGDGARQFGDCIDCGLCVRVCPTGIDIRNGTQLECVHCAACIDACDSMMSKVGRPTGLIRYDTEHQLAGQASRILRPRVVIYGAILLVYLSAFSYFASTRQLSEFQILRVAQSASFTVLPDGRIANQLSVHLSNKGSAPESYSIEVVNAPGVELITPLRSFPVPAGELRTVPVFVNFERQLLQHGSLHITFRLSNTSGYFATKDFVLIGPQ